MAGLGICDECDRLPARALYRPVRGPVRDRGVVLQLCGVCGSALLERGRVFEHEGNPDEQS